MANDSRAVLRLAHSPDPDDAFMWWPLFERDGLPPRVPSARFRFEGVTADIETLNQVADKGIDALGSAGTEALRHQGNEQASVAASQRTLDASRPRCLDASSNFLEITAISCAQYPFVKDRYALTSCGASMGDGYGPKLISRMPMNVDDLKRPDVVLAIPGERTTAFTATNLLLGKNSFRHAVVPFEQIIERVVSGEFAAGLIIHEGQLTFEREGLHLIEDLGAWWWKQHRLPLPLGVNVIRRDLEQMHGEGTLEEVTALLLSSVEYALAHRTQSVEYALGFARDMGADLADRFIEMYVNKWTLNFGENGRNAVRAFLKATHEAGLSPDPGEIDFIEPAATAAGSAACLGGMQS